MTRGVTLYDTSAQTSDALLFFSHETSDLVTDISTPPIDLALLQVRRETDPTNIGRGLGVMLRKGYELTVSYVASFLTWIDSITTFPQAEAKAVPSKGASRIEELFDKKQQFAEMDNKFQEKIQNDDDIYERVSRDFNAMGKNTKEAFNRASQENAETYQLMETCLKGIKAVRFYHPTWSLEKITNLGMSNLLAGYDVAQNEMLIIGTLEGRHNVGTLIHECGHYEEQQKKIQYDIDKIEECAKNLHTALARGVRCFNQEDKAACPTSPMQLYYHRPAIVSCSQVGTADSFDARVLPNAHDIPLNVVVTFNVERSFNNRTCIVHPVSLSIPSVDARPVTTYETAQLNYLTNLSILKGLTYPSYAERIRTIYDINLSNPNAKSAFRVENEMHGALVDRVTSDTLKEFCPKGFFATREEKRQEKQKSAKQEL